MAEGEKLEVRSKTKRVHRWAFPVGLSIVALAVVGAITLISFGVNGIKHLTDKTSLKQEYAIFIRNVVRNDPLPFDDVSKANMSQLLDSAIWDIIGTGELESGKYEYSDTDPNSVGFRIPQAEVEARIVRLFGNEIKPQHDSVLGSGYTFLYDAAAKKYTIPVTGISPIYFPQVYTIDKKGGSIILTVGYMGYGEWDMNELNRPSEPNPVKFMKITLRERKTDVEGLPPYYVGALQAADPESITIPTAKKKDQTQPEITLAPDITSAAETGDTTTAAETDDNTSAAETETVLESVVDL